MTYKIWYKFKNTDKFAKGSIFNSEDYKIWAESQYEKLKEVYDIQVFLKNEKTGKFEPYNI